jgi:hypothetical protein
MIANDDGLTTVVLIDGIVLDDDDGVILLMMTPSLVIPRGAPNAVRVSAYYIHTIDAFVFH